MPLDSTTRETLIDALSIAVEEVKNMEISLHRGDGDPPPPAGISWSYLDKLLRLQSERRNFLSLRQALENMRKEM